MCLGFHTSTRLEKQPCSQLYVLMRWLMDHTAKYGLSAIMGSTAASMIAALNWFEELKLLVCLRGIR